MRVRFFWHILYISTAKAVVKYRDTFIGLNTELARLRFREIFQVNVPDKKKGSYRYLEEQGTKSQTIIRPYHFCRRIQKVLGI